MPIPSAHLIDAALDPADGLYPGDLSEAEAEAAVNPPLPPLTPEPAPELDATERALASWLEQKRPSYVELLEALVNINSGSYHQAGIARALNLLEAELRPLGFEVERHEATALAGTEGPLYGPHRVLRLPGPADRPHLLLVGHVDTVFEPGCGFEQARVDDDRMYGPGAADMKGGLVAVVAALQALASVGMLDQGPVSLLLNGDEEISSRGSRPLLESLAAEADLGLVFEPGRPSPFGAVTLARKGVGAFVMRVRGRSAHSGNRYIDGVSAVDELARKVIAIQRLTDLRRGRTLNVGIFRTPSGAKRNKVADEAMAEFDLRVSDPQDAEQVLTRVREIAAHPLTRNPWTGESACTELDGGLVRPPMPATERRTLFVQRLAGLAQRLSVPFGAVSVGGGSDANIAAANGLLALDGLGPVGGGLHTVNEWVDLRTLSQRALLTAVLMKRVWDGRFELPPRSTAEQTARRRPAR